jgi:hypothetical protein
MWNQEICQDPPTCGQDDLVLLMITLISNKKLGGYKIMRNTVSNDKTFFFFHILYFLQNNTSNGSSNTRSIAHDLISNTIFLRFDSDLANRVPSPLFIFECIHSFCFVLLCFLFVLLFHLASRAMSTCNNDRTQARF